MQMYLNVLRRWLVRKLLGDGLAVEVREKPSGYELQLIDLRRLIPYGFWKVEKNLRHKNLYNLSGKGYVAVRPMAKTNLDGYAAGYITNALENGHAVRPASGKAKKKRQSRAKANRVQGKYMYRNTGQQEAKRAAEEGARIIEAKILAHMEGRSV